MSPRKPINPFVLALRSLVVLALAVLLGMGVYAVVNAAPGNTVGLESAEHGAEAGGGQVAMAPSQASVREAQSPAALDAQAGPRTGSSRQTGHGSCVPLRANEGQE